MNQTALRVVFFDVGGTLLRPSPSVGAIYARVGDHYGFHARAAEWEQAFRTSWRAMKSAEDSRLTTADKNWWRALVFRVLDTLELRADGDAKQRYFEELFDAFAGAEAWQVDPGAVEVLRSVRARGLHVGVISNWDARLRPLLKAVRLDAQLDSITVSCEVQAEKPAPEIFRAALRTSCADPGEAVHVGDSYAEDVRGAQAVGMRAILIDRTGEPLPDCMVVPSLRDLLAVMGEGIG